MKLRHDCGGHLLLLTMTVGLGTLLSAANHSGLNQAPACTAGPRLCYDTPVNAGPLINTALFEGGPSLSQDGLTLLFGAARRNSLGALDEDIYMATRETTAEAFGPAQNLGPTVNALGFGDYSPELSIDGLTLYFSSSRPGGQGEADLYVTTRSSIDDPWEPAKNLGASVNSAYFEGQPSVSANGKTLYWDSVRPDGFGDFDIWMATRENVGEPFGPAVNLGPAVNTAGPEFGRRPQPERETAVFLIGQTRQRWSDRHLGSRASDEVRCVGYPDQCRYAQLAILPGDASIPQQWSGGVLHVVSTRRLRRARHLVRQSLAVRRLLRSQARIDPAPPDWREAEDHVGGQSGGDAECGQRQQEVARYRRPLGPNKAGCGGGI
jgi:hypothetical protein